MSAITLPRPTCTPRPAGQRRGADLQRLALPIGIGLLVVWLALRGDEVAAGLRSLVGAAPGWLLVALLTAILVQVAAAGALHAVVPGRLRFDRTCMIQVAGTAAAAITPAGLGSAAVHAMELERAGTSRQGSWAAVVTVRIVTFLLHLLALAVALPLVRGLVAPHLELPLPLVVLGGLGVVAGASALARSTSMRAKAERLWQQRPSGDLLRRRAGVLVTGAGGTTLARGLTLWAALQAVGGRVPPLAVLGLFLAADAAGALSGAPNGLGAFDVVVLAGLEAAGIAVSTTVAAVLLYRLLTTWLPVLPGLAALASLRRVADLEVAAAPAR